MENKTVLKNCEVFVFWSDKEKIMLVEVDKIFIRAKLLNALFLSNLVKNLKIAVFKEVNPFAEEMSHPTLKAIFKHNKNPSVIAINDTTNGRTFQFSWVSVDDTFK